MSFRHRLYGETETGWKGVLIETDEGVDDLMITGPGEVSILLLAFDPSQTDHEIPLNPYLGAAKHLDYAAYQDKMSVESLVNQGWRYHLLRVGNAIWHLNDDDARFFYTLLGHPSSSGQPPSAS